MFTLILMWESSVGISMHSVPGFDSFKAAHEAGCTLLPVAGGLNFKVVKMSIQ